MCRKGCWLTFCCLFLTFVNSDSKNLKALRRFSESTVISRSAVSLSLYFFLQIEPIQWGINLKQTDLNTHTSHVVIVLKILGVVQKAVKRGSVCILYFQLQTEDGPWKLTEDGSDERLALKRRIWSARRCSRSWE